uniref:Uncharacterized protein n=1 Tax=viral metagenome TaxID=1070528 RepID=A0A6C0F7H3_9ZZZZ|tara:strand:- start:43 stop:474 length:432 start_codon:yes stop_codon:yes gene_type:complete
MDASRTMSDILKESIKDNGDVKEEVVIHNVECIHCKSTINDKPWITVCVPSENYNVHACGYTCARNLKYYVGVGYWNNVVNKEDFSEPRPVIKSELYAKDITANFGIDGIRYEIEQEEKRSREIEEEYGHSDGESPSVYSDDY